MDLKRELDKFLSHLRSHALPDFAEECIDTYTPTYDNVYNELSRLGTEMRVAVKSPDKDLFETCKSEYLKYFKTINVVLAQRAFIEVLDYYLDEGLDNDSSTGLASDVVNRDRLLRYWLPGLDKEGKTQGEKGFQIANELHTQRGNPYVLALKERAHRMAA